MGWFWGDSNDGDKDKSQDPLKNLDPSLREFLKKESPVKYDSTKSADTTVLSQTKTLEPTLTSTTEDPTKPNVPSQSLYQDGRYAHLWKTYQPQAEVEQAAKSDAEKIQDVIDGYKYRKAEIGRAALENCALEQWDVNECFRSGGWQARLTMCREENRKLERCYTMQGKFLKALGYLSTYDRPPAVDEQIQLHADTLYHRMIDQEKQIEEAKAEGRPVPIFPPLISKSRPGQSDSAQENNKLKASDLSPKVQASFKKRLEGLNDDERLVEERAIQAEIEAGEQVAGQLGKIYEKQDEERRQRKEQGRETISDKFFSVFRGR
ncbi:putative autophagy protein [Botrytis fragariae]|uniref:Putative autophagy protein n=1 Tax=Botrytis fragariae TaxID=1964551 RepID=A0A8H6B2S3_9HELO|nr:putative autophagy protein [Botrytis fragariae]KAF5878149.1 putative autophagy protein [Botrytis fragariae]